MNVIVLLAGDSKPFEEQGYLFPKYLIEIDGKPMVQHVIEHLISHEDLSYIFVIRKDDAVRFHFDNVLKLLVPKSEIIVVESETRGAACSALLAIEHINTDEPLLIVNGDQVVDIDLEDAINTFRKKQLDGGIITFESVHPRWSYVRLDSEGLVIEAAEKRPISKYATAGIYYFKHGSDFVESAMEMIRKDAQVNGSYYVCPAYNEMVLKQARIGIYQILRDSYFPLAAPQWVQTYEEHLKALGRK